MGEKQNEPFQLSFNASLKADSQESRVTSDGGLILALPWATAVARDGKNESNGSNEVDWTYDR
jgi:hypothetical protein